MFNFFVIYVLISFRPRRREDGEIAKDRQALQGLTLNQLRTRAKGLRYNLGRGNISAKKRKRRVIKVGLNNISNMNKAELIEKILELVDHVNIVESGEVGASRYQVETDRPCIDMSGMNREECTTQAYAVVSLSYDLVWVPHISLLFERTLFLQAEGECMVCAVNSLLGYIAIFFKDATKAQEELNVDLPEGQKYNGKRSTGWDSKVIMAALFKKGYRRKDSKALGIKRNTEWDYLMSEDRIKEKGKYVMKVKSRTLVNGQPAFFHSFSIDYSEPFPLMFDGLVPYAMALTEANMMYMCFNLKQNIVEVYKIFRL